MNNPDSPGTRSGHIALAGLPNVGKSTLLNTLVGEHLAIVSPKAQATRLPVVGIRTESDTQYIFHDLPGLLEPGYLMQERMRAAAIDQLGRSDVVLHLHPANEAPAPAFDVTARLDKPISAPVVLVYTKGDRVSAEIRRELLASGAIVTSENGGGIPQLLARINDLLPIRPFEYDAEDVGVQPMRFFVTEYLREAAFELLEEELPYAFAAQVEEFREDDRPVYIRVTLYVERETQKAIVIGAAGRTIKALGTHARKRLESLMGIPVYLDCWVKVLPNWRKNATSLGRLGFPDLASASHNSHL